MEWMLNKKTIFLVKHYPSVLDKSANGKTIITKTIKAKHSHVKADNVSLNLKICTPS